MTKNHTFRISLFIACSFVTAHLLCFLLPQVFESLNLQTNDTLFRVRYRLLGKGAIKPCIIHVDINDSSFRKFKNLEWNRSTHARIIDILASAHVDAIAFDIIFPYASQEEENQALLDATSRAKMVYYPVILKLDKHKGTPFPETEISDNNDPLKTHLWHLNVTQDCKPLKATSAITSFRDLGRACKGLGHITAFPDRDGVYRRFPLLIQYMDGYYPSLTFRVVCDYLRVIPSKIDVYFGRHIILRDAKLPGGRKKDIVIPIDQQGQMIINFAGPWTDSFSHYSYDKLLEIGENDADLEMLTDELENDLAIVANVSTGSGDIGTAPVETIYPLCGLHANVANTILTENFLYNLSVWKQLLVELVVAVLIIFSALKFRSLGFSLLVVSFFSLFMVFAGGLFFYQNTLTYIIRPPLGMLFSMVTVNMYRFLMEEREKAYIRLSFENYFAPSVLDKILKSRDKINASEKKVLTVLFSDISGFTSWCTTQTPEEIRTTLNEYFDEMCNIVFKYEGTIDKYMGDGLMVFFGDPFEQEDHALRAVKTAIEMQQKVYELKQRWEKAGRLPIRIRIGINTGEVVVGNMGSKKRMDYTVLGANVNFAQRLESNAPIEGILVSESVYQQVKDAIQTRFAGSIVAKGIKEEFNTYEIPTHFHTAHNLSKPENKA